MIGKLERVPLREVWKHEATGFTKWLEENPDVLSNAIGISFRSIEREKAAGDFNVDLVVEAEDESFNPVVIENQLEKSDHDHLGKLLTYLAAVEAKTAIWIASSPRPEHSKAISWLNDSSPAYFYMLKIEAVKIGDSLPAPMLTLISGPSEESKSVQRVKKEMAERHIDRRRFWTQLLALVRDKGIKLHANIEPGTGNWIATSAGKAGLGLSYVVRMGDARVEMYIGCGEQDENMRIFEHLRQSKEQIEQAFGGPLDWQELLGKKACRIAKRIEGYGGLKDQDNWGKLQEAMVDAMVRLDNALKPHIRDLAS